MKNKHEHLICKDKSWVFIKMSEPDILAGGKILHKICKRYLKKLNKNYHEN